MLYWLVAVDVPVVEPKLQPPAPPPLSSVIVDRPDDEDTYVPPEGLNLPNGIITVCYSVCVCASALLKRNVCTCAMCVLCIHNAYMCVYSVYLCVV